MQSVEAADLLGQLSAQAGTNRTSLFSGPGGQRDTLQRRTYETLRMALMAGVFNLGQEVTLRSLAAALGTSAMPVREAVSRLIAERALTMLPNRTVIVPRMTRGRCVELFQARQALERIAAEAACARATSELIEHIAEIDHDLRAKVADKDLSGALMGNLRFHFALYRAGQNDVILPLIETLWLQAGPFMSYSLSIPGVRWTSRHHQAILNSLRSGNAAAVGQAIVLDIDETLAQLLRKADFDDAVRPSRRGTSRRGPSQSSIS